MRAGVLRNRVRIERAVETRNEYGEVVKTWQPFGVEWHFANVRVQSGAEVQRSGVDYAENKVSVRLRYLSAKGVSAGMRVVCLDADWAGQIMTMESVLPDVAMRRHVEWVCVLGRKEGR